MLVDSGEGFFDSSLRDGSGYAARTQIAEDTSRAETLIFEARSGECLGKLAVIGETVGSEFRNSGVEISGGGGAQRELLPELGDGVRPALQQA